MRGSETAAVAPAELCTLAAAMLAAAKLSACILSSRLWT